jgi:hypothetical protein
MHIIFRQISTVFYSILNQDREIHIKLHWETSEIVFFVQYC